MTTPAWPSAHISDGLLGLLFCVASFLDNVLHLSLDLGDVCLQLLLGVDQAGVLSKIVEIRKTYSLHSWDFTGVLLVGSCRGPNGNISLNFKYLFSAKC